MRLLEAILRFIGDVSKFKTVKHSDQRETSIKYGVKSIIFSIIAFLSSFLIVFGINSMSEFGGIFLGLLSLLLGISITISFIIAAIKTMIFQLILNRKVISFIALLFCISSIIGICVVLNSFKL